MVVMCQQHTYATNHNISGIHNHITHINSYLTSAHIEWKVTDLKTFADTEIEYIISISIEQHFYVFQMSMEHEYISV